MTCSSLSKLCGLLRDPVQRRWSLGRLRRAWPAPAAFKPHHPPYLPEELPESTLSGRCNFVAQRSEPPCCKLTLMLNGTPLALTPGDAEPLFEREFDNGVGSALHSFNWLTLTPDLDRAWVGALWTAWTAAFADGRPHPLAWRPRLAAERAITMLDFSRRVGLPAPRESGLAALAAHAPAILARLDYRGETATDSELALQGWALYRLGVDLTIESYAEIGLTILREESKRLLGPSGLLREESVARHLRLARAYADSWLTARRHSRAETGDLATILGRMLAVLPVLILPGGLPDVGEAAPGLPLSFFSGLIPGDDANQGWTAQLSAEDRQALIVLRDSGKLCDLDLPRAEGWLRQDIGAWSGLWHATPGGWPRAGHGHQDLGGFELHYGAVPVFVDPGNPNDACSEMAAIHRSAAAHNGLEIDGQAPYPFDQADYSEAFRHAVAGPSPRLRSEPNGVSLAFDGFSRLGGPRETTRRWRFDQDRLSIEDFFKGTGRSRLVRRLVTPLAAEVDEDGAVILSGSGLQFKITCDVRAVLHDGQRRTIDGRDEPLRVITFVGPINLPWRGVLTIQPL